MDIKSQSSISSLNRRLSILFCEFVRMEPHNFTATLSREAQERYIRESLNPETFREVAPQDARFRIIASVIILGANVMADNPIFFRENTPYDEQERLTNEMFKQIAIAVSTGRNIPLTTDFNLDTQPDKVLRFLEMELEPTEPEITSVFENTIYPFLHEAPGSASLILNAGPGDRINQFYPHDPEFYREVFLKNQRNAVIIFDSVDEGLAYKLGTIFSKNGDALRNEPFVVAMLKDFRNRFGVSPQNITIQTPNPLTRIFAFSFANGHQCLLVVFKSRYIRSYEPFISQATVLANHKTLICGIRPYFCKNLFFRNTNFFFENFDFYINVFGIDKRKYMKEHLQDYRIDIKRLRNNPEYTSSQVLYNRLNRGKDHFGPSLLCNPDTRQPADDPYCVRGEMNQAIFWRGLGGKRKTRRHMKKTKKTRKH